MTCLEIIIIEYDITSVIAGNKVDKTRLVLLFRMLGLRLKRRFHSAKSNSKPLFLQFGLTYVEIKSLSMCA